MRGHTQRNKDEVCYRKDGELHAGSARSVVNPRKTPYFMRLSKAEFLAAEALITKLNYRGRGQFFADAVKLMAMILEAVKDRSPEVKHEDLDFRDLEDLVARSAASLACLEKRLPIPVWAQLESSLPQVPRLEPPKP